MCLLSGFVSALFTQSVAAAVLKTRAPYYRETACNSYHPVMFPVSMFLAEIPWIAGMLLTVSLSGVSLSLFAQVTLFACTALVHRLHQSHTS
jgi:hypothetical protein